MLAFSLAFMSNKKDVWKWTVRCIGIHSDQGETAKLLSNKYVTGLRKVTVMLFVAKYHTKILRLFDVVSYSSILESG